jgi:hypothetical protein
MTIDRSREKKEKICKHTIHAYRKEKKFKCIVDINTEWTITSFDYSQLEYTDVYSVEKINLR